MYTYTGRKRVGNQPLGFYGVGQLAGVGDCKPDGTDEFGELCAYVPPEISDNPDLADAVRRYITGAPNAVVPAPNTQPATKPPPAPPLFAGMSANTLMLIAGAIGLLIVLKK